jgi:hypothetical protein
MHPGAYIDQSLRSFDQCRQNVGRQHIDGETRGTPDSVSTRPSRYPTPALWITASNRPSSLTSSATVRVPAMVERSPETTPWAPGAALMASRLRSSFRPYNTTSWPWLISSRAAMRPRPSDDPVIKTRATPAPRLIAPTHPAWDHEWSPCAPRPSPRNPGPRHARTSLRVRQGRSYRFESNR